MSTASHHISLPDQVASCALQHYHTQLGSQKGKPKPNQEWTVYATIVAFHSISSTTSVVSCATGTKCTAQRHNGCILHDCHAEVLARRGLIRVLWAELLDKNRSTGSSKEHLQANSDSTFRTASSSPDSHKHILVESLTWSSDNKCRKYQLDPNIQLHLYISDSPCGDASIYSVKDISTTDTSTTHECHHQSQSVLYTGAKIVVSKANGVEATDCGGSHQLLYLAGTAPTANEDDGRAGHPAAPESSLDSDAKVAREEIQVLGKLRTKAGRSNLPSHMRSTSMSCSDKIVMWSTVGLQGALLTKHLYPPLIPLASVVVSRDSRLDENDVENQHVALKRAICDRAANVWVSLEGRQGLSSVGAALPAWKPMVPSVHVVSQVFESGKAAMALTAAATNPMGRKRKHDAFVDQKKGIDLNEAKISPCGISLNWHQPLLISSAADTPLSDLELVVGARGVKQGKKPKSFLEYENLASRLSRAMLLRDFLWPLELSATMEDEAKGTDHQNGAENDAHGDTFDYHQLKEAKSFPEWVQLKKMILSEDGGGPLAGWLRSLHSSQETIAEPTVTTSIRKVK